MKEGSSGDVVDVVFRGKVFVKDGSKVADVGGGGQSEVVIGGTEVVGGFGEGFGTDDDGI